MKILILLLTMLAASCAIEPPDAMQSEADPESTSTAVEDLVCGWTPTRCQPQTCWIVPINGYYETECADNFENNYICDQACDTHGGNLQPICPPVYSTFACHTNCVAAGALGPSDPDGYLLAVCESNCDNNSRTECQLLTRPQ